MDDVVICIPTKRPPPILSLESYSPGKVEVIIIADPDVFSDHTAHYADTPYRVVRGQQGWANQVAQCYIQASRFDFPWYFRMDDDLSLRTFVHKDGTYPSLTKVIRATRQCVDECNVGLAGFMNGSNRFWMGEGFGRTYGLVHGGAHLCVSHADPFGAGFVHPKLKRFEDVYRSCAHRQRDGAVGRVKFIGFDKSKSSNAKAWTGNVTSITSSKKDMRRSRDLILDQFAGFVTCDGTRQIHAGTVDIFNWRMRRHPEYVP